MESSRIDVVVPAAGVGKRMRLNIPKQYALLSNKTVLEHTVYALLNCPYVGNVIVGVSAYYLYFYSLGIIHNPRLIKGKGGILRFDIL